MKVAHFGHLCVPIPYPRPHSILIYVLMAINRTIVEFGAVHDSFLSRLRFVWDNFYVSFRERWGVLAS